MNKSAFPSLLLATTLALPTTLAAADARNPSPETWDAPAAASYLDSRMEWWMNWSSSKRDHETFCVSCHTALPYAIGRSSLHAALNEHEPAPQQRKLLDNVAKRVRIWKDAQPFYADSAKSPGKTVESRGTEAVLNAVILVTNNPKQALTPDARLALDNMWSEQLTSGEAAGAFPWLQFHNAPWEGDSQYYGAALAALATSLAPPEYRNSPGVADRLGALRAYLAKERGTQMLIDRMIVLWASTRLPDLLSPAEKQAIVDEALSKQQTDGGFGLSSFIGQWKRRDKTAIDARSDGYATGLVTYVLSQTGLPNNQAALRRGLDWLAHNQDKTDGRWPAYSLNKQRELSSDAGRFMSDAATGFAVLALGSTK